MKPLKLLAACWTAILILALAAGPTGSDDGGFLQVTGPCKLSFPGDHGPHPGYRTEWWYYTGQLTAADQRRFGFQLTFFRSRLKPPADRHTWPKPASAWRTDQIYLAHAALTDVTGGRHLQAEKTARPVLSLAGAEQDGAALKIHLHTWQAVITADSHHLQADADDFALTLDLQPVKAPVHHGEAGYSRKGRAPEQASCYYSFTRLQADGTVTLDGIGHRVRGTAWMDHEFSTAPLQEGIIGWDWFSLQLSDQTELMIYWLRHPDGSINPASSGTYVMPAGQARHLERGDVRIEPLSYWTSPHTGARYPVKWNLAVTPLKCNLTVTADLADQEMRTSRSTHIVYWEGSVSARGLKEDKPVEGIGYVELTGYAKPFDAPL